MHFAAFFCMHMHVRNLTDNYEWAQFHTDHENLKPHLKRGVLLSEYQLSKLIRIFAWNSPDSWKLMQVILSVKYWLRWSLSLESELLSDVISVQSIVKQSVANWINGISNKKIIKKYFGIFNWRHEKLRTYLCGFSKYYWINFLFCIWII